MKNILSKRNKGFTMIELLVAISVFSIIIAIASGIFISSLRSNRTSVALISANSDGQLALEQMARMIRKGLNFSVHEVDGAGLLNSSDPAYKCLRFVYGGNWITYRWNKAKRSLEWNDKLPVDCNSEDFSGIVSENLRVDYANFRIINQGTDYPLITIVLRVGSNKIVVTSGGQAFINLQTSMSPRNDGRY